MEYGAIDLHKRRSVIRIVAADGTVQLNRKVATTQADLTDVFGGRARGRILLESSTESEWVAQHLESLGHEVVVADPNYLPMYGSRSRKVKTDQRDVAALAEANRTGVYRRAHRPSAAARALRREVRVRQQLVRTRTGMICTLRAMLRQEGLALPSGSADRVVARLKTVAVPSALQVAIRPLCQVLRQLNVSIAHADATLAARAVSDPVTQQLMTAPGVGPVVALTFQAVLDDPARFGGDAARVTAFLGLVPTEDTSAERQRKGHITKSGPSDLRALLVQASWVILRTRRAAGAALRTWAHALAARRGKRVAVIALARRLSRILYAMWRDRRDFVAPAIVAA